MKKTYKIFIYKNKKSEEAISLSLKKWGIKNYTIEYNQCGKPGIKGNEAFFNVSNKKNITVVVVSQYKIGVDLEFFTYKQNVVEKVFNDKEKKFINNARNKKKAFTKIWVYKEAYAKMIGLGLSYGIHNIDSTKLDNIDLIKKRQYYIAISYQK